MSEMVESKAVVVEWLWRVCWGGGHGGVVMCLMTGPRYQQFCCIKVKEVKMIAIIIGK